MRIRDWSSDVCSSDLGPEIAGRCCPVTTPTLTADDAADARLAEQIDDLGHKLGLVRQSIGRVIFGQQAVVDQTLITLLSGGHGLLIGVPGLAKTRLVETLGTVFGLEDKRVQCTPDLMPADILGSEVLERSEEHTSELQSLMRISYAVFCLKKKKKQHLPE